MNLLKKRWLYVAAIIAALLQTSVMLAGVQQRISILRNGSEVVLRTMPVDPRDLMRGDFVTLSYEISRLPARLISGEPPHKSGLNYIYVVVVKQADGVWTADRAQYTRPDALKDNEMVLRGEVEAPFQIYDDNSTIPVVYGIERYYVPEGEGLAVEHAQRDSAVDIVLSVNEKGVAAIRALRIDGKQVFDEPLF
ncbi:GDYXXLXY domain-containing protein [Ochrobactrum sp. MR28]|nr:GDYXXLXY domain-containing protein [Ochrobactrum sp. MR28]MBX8815053.1 GDYXXLXY domain-containing protein [Ochrobactrum sp. MR31]